jgi:hypothetical protein
LESDFAPTNFRSKAILLESNKIQLEYVGNKACTIVENGSSKERMMTRSNFKDGDKIGLGLTYEPKNGSIKCFAICNRKLLGKKN